MTKLTSSSIFVLLLFIGFGFSSIGISISFTGAIPVGQRQYVIPAGAYIPHSPITITNNTDFFRQGWPGNGTEDDPYVIESFNITASSTGIKVSNTDVYFEVRNCLISAPSQSSSDGIVLENVTHGTVKGCVVELYSAGVHLWSSFSCRLANNTVSNNELGFSVSSSSSISLMDNTATSNGIYGVYIYGSDSCTLVHNTARKNRYGFYLLRCNSSTLTNNTATRNEYGFYIRSASCTMMDNTATDNTYGFYLSAHHEFFGSIGSYTLTHNTATDNDYGFSLFSMSSKSPCILIHNIATRNAYGIHLAYSSDCILTNNTLNNNGLVFDGYLLAHWLHNMSDNTVNDRPLGYFKSVNDTVIDGDQYGQVILANCSRIVVKNGTFIAASIGIQLAFSTNCTLTHNTAMNNAVSGIHLSESLSCIMKNNTLNNNGLVFDGYLLAHWLHNMSDNTVNDRPLGYFKSVNDTVIDGDQYGQVILANCSRIVVKNGTFIAASIGIQLAFSTNCTLTHNTATGNGESGFFLASSDSCILTHNTAIGNRHSGFRFSGSDSCILTHNTATGNGESGFFLASSDSCILTHNTAIGNRHSGFRFSGSDSCILTHNMATENDHGFYLSSSFCILTNNTAALNGFGICLPHPSFGNLLLFNRLFYNSQSNGHDDGGQNSWDNGIHGNYWGDYGGEGTYLVPGFAGSVDHHPYVLEACPPTILIYGPAILQYEEGATGHLITWGLEHPHPGDYVIYRNGSVVRAGVWNCSSENITISVDGLTVGLYNYTLVVRDIVDNRAAAAVFVRVVQKGSSPEEPEDRGDVFSLLVMVSAAAIMGEVAIAIVIVRDRREH